MARPRLFEGAETKTVKVTLELDVFQQLQAIGRTSSDAALQMPDMLRKAVSEYIEARIHNPAAQEMLASIQGARGLRLVTKQSDADKNIESSA